MQKIRIKVGPDSDSTSSSSRISTASIQSTIDSLKQNRVCKNTQKNYQSVWKVFNEFFVRLDVKPHTWEERICLFVGYLISMNKRSQTVRSYVSALRGILKLDGVILNENQFLLSSLTRACKLQNDRVRIRLPIKRPLLNLLLKEMFLHFSQQPYLSSLYRTLFCVAYFGMFRIGELTNSTHTIMVKDVQIADNKEKVRFVLRSSKTHGLYQKPQIVKITSSAKTSHELNQFCPYSLIREYVSYRPNYRDETEPFFVFRDNSALQPSQARAVMKKIIKKLGLNEKLYNTHSYRAGRAVDLVDLKVPVTVVAKLGRWSSNSVYKYLS